MSAPPPARRARALTILLACPKCGAPFEADDETHSVTCEHCASLLLLEAPERDELYVADGQVRSRDELPEILIEYRVQAQRAEIIHRYQDSDGNRPPEIFIQNRLRSYERKLRDSVKLLEARELFVPYWHLTGSIVQGILGRLGEDIKTTRVRAFAVEHTVPGYDTLEANLRDRGLRLDAALARPLTAAFVAEKKLFLPRVEVPEQQYREIEKWLTRDLDRRIEPMMKHALYLFPRRLLVYRPYWLGRLVTDKGTEWILFDAAFRTIAGYPSEPEARELLKLRDRDPLGASQESFRRVKIVAARCPDCGAEHRFDPRALIEICANCHLGLRLAADGVKLAPYAHAAVGDVALDGEQLPFWRYELKAQLDGKAVASLEDYAKAALPQPPPGFAPRGRHLWIPAFRLLGTEPGDAAFKAIAEWIHAAPPEVHEGKLPVGGRPVFRGVSLPEPQARALAPFVLLALFTKTAAARLNNLLLRKAVVNAKLALSSPSLVTVPFARAGPELTAEGSGVRLPELLMSGGPELQALRVTVHAAMAAAGR